MRLSLLATALLFTVPALAEIPGPPRAITDPKSLESPANPDAKPVPLADLDVARAVPDAAWSPDGEWIYTSNNLSGRFNIWKSPAKGGWPVQLTQSDDSQMQLAPSSDGKWLVFVQDKGGDEFFDIMAVPADGGAVTRLTDTPEIAENNPRFSPDGSRIAMDFKPKSASSVDIAIMDIANRSVRQLTTEKSADHFWSVVDWMPDGKSLIGVRSNILMTQSSLWRIDAASGAMTELTPISGDEMFYAADVSPDGRYLSISTNKGSGQFRAGVYEFATGKIRWLKPTPWEQRARHITLDSHTMMVLTNIDGRSVLSLVDLESMAERELVFPAGISDTGSTVSNPYSPDGNSALIFHSGADMPSDIWIAGLDGKASRYTRLSMASLSNLPKSHIVTYRSFDGTPISAILTMPYNLKRDGSNPAIVVPHGGPTGQSQDFWSGQIAALASRGYMVIQPNFRGSTGYGVEFQAANIGTLGEGDLKDVLAARDFLISTGYADPKKFGITGGSYGGYMTLMAIGKAPDAFAAAVQEFGVIDWFTMEKTSDPWLQRYLHGLLGDPVKDREAYIKASPMTYIKAAKAPLLSLQGENDIRVPREQAQMVADSLKAQGAVAETIFYPDEGHGFMKRENRADARRRTVEWFDKYLKGK